MLIKNTESKLSSGKSPVLNAGYLPETPLYGMEEGTGWELSPRPFALEQAFVDELYRLGQVLWSFEWACERMYRESLKGNLKGNLNGGSVPPWLASILNQGKPESLVKYATMKRFRSQMPLVIRPDLLLTEQGMMLTEVDSVPGGIGFTTAMNQAYKQSGFSVLESELGMAEAFLKMLKAVVPEKENPVITVILSDEAEDYRQEMTWLAEQIQAIYPDFYVIHPREVELVRDCLVFSNEATQSKERSIDLIYRFFELFDLPNIPKMDLIQYAIKRGWVVCTPVFKPHLEEKSWLALIHHPVLRPFWEQFMGKDDFYWLKARIPQSWIMDPAILPASAVIPDLELAGRTLQSFEALKGISQRERQLVIKPSGFSPLAWGSRGVAIGHDLSGEAWDSTVENALVSFKQTPYILQKFHKPKAHSLERLDLETGAVTPFQGRTRLCPYYFVSPDAGRSPEKATIELAGVLATSCPADKKIIHGMKDAIMSPCMLKGE